MINCQVTQYGKVKEDVGQMNGLVFCDNHGIERSNHMDTSVVEASLKEWHYDKFGIMNQHFRGKADQAGFSVFHEVRPAMMFSIATQGQDYRLSFGISFSWHSFSIWKNFQSHHP